MYYVLERGPKPGRWIGKRPYIDGVSWTRGAAITRPVPDPISLDLKPLNPTSADHGPSMPPLLEGGMPLMRDDLILALAQIGVDNLHSYNALIADPDNGKSYANYKAINVIGLVAAADMGKSEATVHPGGAIIDVDFDSLVVDETKAHDMLLFRLAESTNAILVHRRVRDFLLARGFDELVFYDPREVAL